jgi:hypothetical protein
MYADFMKNFSSKNTFKLDILLNFPKIDLGVSDLTSFNSPLPELNYTTNDNLLSIPQA